MRRCGSSYEGAIEPCLMGVEAVLRLTPAGQRDQQHGVKTDLLPGLRGELVAIHSRHADVHDHGGGTIVWHAVNPDGPS
jgi:hypothetical protein